MGGWLEGLDRESEGAISGVVSAVVSGNDDPEGLGRVRLSLPWRDGFETGWARVATPMAGAGRGLYFLPEVGDEVLVAFERGDVNFPYVIGSLWNGRDRPPRTNEGGSNDVRTIRTRGGHTLLFDDGEEGRVEISLADGKSVIIHGDGILIDDGANRIALDAKAGSVTIDAKQTLKLKAPTISIEASAPIDIKGGAANAIATDDSTVFARD
ncbi:MAG TPA: phage baseplate assembly protein V [Allosphingosinicella sp.]|jgi:uncharacterized protein involved in type VI secretion and phage assembly